MRRKRRTPKKVMSYEDALNGQRPDYGDRTPQNTPVPCLPAGYVNALEQQKKLADVAARRAKLKPV